MRTIETTTIVAEDGTLAGGRQILPPAIKLGRRCRHLLLLLLRQWRQRWHPRNIDSVGRRCESCRGYPSLNPERAGLQSCPFVIADPDSSLA